MKKIAFIILLGLVGLNSYSQGIVSGIVSSNEGPLPGASVYLEGTYDGTSTNSNGEFSFMTSKTGIVILKASFLGFEPFSKELHLEKY